MKESEAKEAKVVVNFQAPKSLRERANEAAEKLDTDLSKELRRAMRDLVARAEAMEKAA